MNKLKHLPWQSKIKALGPRDPYGFCWLISFHLGQAGAMYGWSLLLLVILAANRISIPGLVLSTHSVKNPEGYAEKGKIYLGIFNLNVFCLSQHCRLLLGACAANAASVFLLML